MRLTITIDLDGAAFEDNPSEIGDTLRQRDGFPVTSWIEQRAGTFRDSNGNTCGEWRVSK